MRKDETLLCNHSDDIIKRWIIDNLSTRRKRISQNYTRYNFALLKEKYPIFWSIVENRKFEINGKDVCFYTKSIFTLKYKNKEFKTKLPNSSEIQKDINKCESDIELLGVLLNHQMRGVQLKCINKLTNFNFENIEKAFCYYNNISIDLIKTNNKNIKFYDSHRGYKTIGNDSEFIKAFCSIKTFKDRVKFLINHKKFRSEFFIKYRSEDDPDITNPENIFCWAFGENIPTCKNCDNTVTFNVYASPFREYCSMKCMYEYNSLTETPVIYKTYMHRARALTQRIYNKNKHTLNPLNYKIGINEYHIDHIKPLWVCFKEGMTLKESCAVENLQLLKHDEHRRKTAKDKISYREKK